MPEGVVSFHQAHELLMKLEQAGFTSAMAQRIIEWPGNGMAAAWVDSVMRSDSDWLCAMCQGRGVIEAPANTETPWVRCPAARCPGPAKDWGGGSNPPRRLWNGSIVPEGIEPADRGVRATVQAVVSELLTLADKRSTSPSTSERLHELAAALSVVYASGDVISRGPYLKAGLGPFCYDCGSKMQPAGSAYVCTSCGRSTGGAS